MSRENKVEKPQDIFPTLEEQLEARDKKRAQDCLDAVVKLCADRDCQVEGIPTITRDGGRIVVGATWQVRALPLKPKGGKAQEKK
jgi:hypothetical protein